MKSDAIRALGSPPANVGEPLASGASEAALILLARMGDDEAFGELVRRRQGWLRGMLRRLSGNAAIGDDLAQEAFIQAWKTLAQLRAPEAFGGWLRQIAVNTWLRHARRRHLSVDVFETEEEDWDSRDGEDALTGRIDLERALAQLRPAERLCIVLAYDEGMSHGAVAAVTGIPLGTVKSHIARGTTRLRARLGALKGSK